MDLVPIRYTGEYVDFIQLIKHDLDINGEWHNIHMYTIMVDIYGY